MFGTLKGRILLIVAVVAASVAFLLINGITLGLDLQGGMYLDLEVADPQGTMTAEARRDATDQALQVINNRIDEFGVMEPLIQKAGEDRIIELKDSSPDIEAERALAELQKVAARFEDPGTPYYSLVNPMWKRRRYGDYDHLARIKEWSIAAEDEELP